MDWKWLQNGWQNGWAVLLALGAGIFAITELACGFKWTRKHIWSPICSIFTLQTRGKLDAMAAQLANITKELSPNGGSSLRDSVDGLRATVNLIDTRQVLQNERLKAITGDAPEGLKEFNAIGQLIWANRTYARWVNRDLAELVGNGWINTVFLADRDRVKREWAEVVREGRNYETAYRDVTPDGKVFLVAVRATAMRASDGSVIGFMKTLTKAEDTHHERAA